MLSKINEFIYYEDGRIFWKRDVGRKIKKGDRAGTNHLRSGYRDVVICGDKYREHRVIYFMFNGYLPEFVDHVDGNKSNNKIENLRPCTRSQNALNRMATRGNKSGVKGVYFDKSKGKWRARIMVNKKVVYNKLFDDLKDASDNIDINRKIHHGEFFNNSRR